MGRELFSATLRVNEAQQRRIVGLVEEEVGIAQGLTIGVWGLAFKAGTDDVRDSLALRIIANARRTRSDRRRVRSGGSRNDVAEGMPLGADGPGGRAARTSLVLTEWPEFYEIPRRRTRSWSGRRVVVDGRNVLDAERVAAAGLTYRGVGSRQPRSLNRTSRRKLIRCKS